MIYSDTISTTDSDKDKSPATKPALEEIKADLKPVDQSSSPVNEPEQGSEANEPNREGSLTRRALLHKAGWAVPVILAVGLPSTVLAGMTSPSRHHDHKPKHHFDCWPKKKHSPHTDKKKHWFDTDKKKHWPDTDKKKHWFDTDKKKHWPDADKKGHWPDADKKKPHYFDRLWW
jgi:hypothetical protein